MARRTSPFAASLPVLVAAVGLPSAGWSQVATDPRVDSVFAEWDRPDSPGCALGVYRDGRIAYARGYGMADLERRVPILPNTVFDIGSTSKQFTASSIVLLAGQGKLSLDDDVRRFIPELPVYSAPITIRHLLHHTSGLRDYIGLLTLSGARIDDVTTEDDALAMIARQKELNFTPGSEHLYSNSGYFLLSVIVERASGKSLRDFASEHIFEPLGMTRTHYLGSYDDVVPDRALAYAPRRGGGMRTDMSRWLQLGDGAVFTTVEELLWWDANFYDPKVGGQAMLAELHTTGTLADGKPLTYALGLSIGEYRGQRTVSHGGSWGGYRADLMRFPEQRYAVAVLCNLATTNSGRLARQVADIHLASVLAPAAQRPVTRSASPGTRVAVAASALQQLAGTYREHATRAMRTLVFDGGALYLAAGANRLELAPQSATRFTVVGAPAEVTVEFAPVETAEPRRLRWTVTGQPTVTFEKIELVTPSAAALAEYAGSYVSDELQATHRLEAANGALIVRRRGAPADTLRPMTRDEFAVGSASLRFTRDDAGGVTGYLLDLGRIRNLRFQRASAASTTERR